MQESEYGNRYGDKYNGKYGSGYESGDMSEMPCNINVYDCRKCELTGISDVAEFNEREIYLSCKYGEIAVEGEKLKIRNFNGVTGELSVEGDIKGIFRIDKPIKKIKDKKKSISVFG